MNNNDSIQARLSPSQKRLQRPPDFTGNRLVSFRAVFLRHGLPGAVLGVLCLLHPAMRELLGSALTAFYSQPLFYMFSALVILVVLSLYAGFLDRRWKIEKLGWVLYLGLVSAWEEWVFRLAVPYYLESIGVSLFVAVLTSNTVFALAHYFTLRWKWQWCVAVFFFAMALSRQMETHFDLMLVIGVHWVFTFLNTPRLPGRRYLQGGVG
ncbi:MAG: type II CAAX prenyl endopeptidase Rce1 family protein [bacterium]